MSTRSELGGPIQFGLLRPTVRRSGGRTTATDLALGDRAAGELVMTGGGVAALDVRAATLGVVAGRRS